MLNDAFVISGSRNCVFVCLAPSGGGNPECKILGTLYRETPPCLGRFGNNWHHNNRNLCYLFFDPQIFKPSDDEHLDTHQRILKRTGLLTELTVQ